MADRAHLERLTKQLANEGKLMEVGWISLRIAAGLIDAPPMQLKQMRMAYMAGCQHLYASIMTMQDEGTEATPADYHRMELIDAELRAYADELIRDLPTMGKA